MMIIYPCKMKSQIIFYENPQKVQNTLSGQVFQERIQLIVDSCDILPAIWDGKSRGTKTALVYARKVNKPAFLTEFRQGSRKSS